MPHIPRPFYRAPRRTWFVEINKKQHPLGKHPPSAPEPRRGRDGFWIAPPEILQAYHEKMAEITSGTAGVESSPLRATDSAPFVAVILVEFVGWLRNRLRTGPIFRNTTDGRPWCPSSVQCRFQNLRVTLGRRKITELGLVPPKLRRLKAHERSDALVRAEHEQKVKERRRINELAREHGPRYNLHAFRHSFITEDLVQGVAGTDARNATSRIAFAVLARSQPGTPSSGVDCSDIHRYFCNAPVRRQTDRDANAFYLTSIQSSLASFGAGLSNSTVKPVASFLTIARLVSQFCSTNTA